MGYPKHWSLSRRWPRRTPVPRAATTLTFSAYARVLYSEVEDAGGLF